MANSCTAAQRFLYFLSLRTGTELIILTLLLNKISGFYGLLAILTGLRLSPLQLSMYIYSLFALVLAGYLTPHLRRQSPIHVLGLAWLYVLDTAVNAIYTATFAINWFLVISQHQHGATGIGKGAKTMGDAAGFTSPKFNVSKVGVVATPNGGVIHGQETVVAGNGAGLGLGHAILEPESVTSISIILMLWSLRIYFILVIMSYARSVLRQHVYSTSSSSGLHRRPDNGDNNLDDPYHGAVVENPFATSREEGKGWEGRLGRSMIALGRSYWLGVDEDDGWARGMGGKFRRSGEAPASAGPMERERRRRSGTGPPPPLPSTPATPGIPWVVQGTK
ncbi:MAG: hypothetical protein M1813_007092 [Trichoglossum hirsutum]|nr:MAG: hypothetical protein M1813_007092 [Trichoglossum hirsutum]